MERLKGEETYKDKGESLTHGCLFKVTIKFMVLRSKYTSFYCQLAAKLDNLYIYIYSLFYINHPLIFWVNNFLHKSKRKISGLRLRDLTRLIKWLELELTYIILSHVLTCKHELPPYKYIHRQNWLAHS
jgi:hypothetical protein